MLHVTGVKLAAGLYCNNSLHFTEDVVDPEQSPYIWLANFARGRPALNHQIPNNTFAATVVGTLFKKKVLQSLITSLKSVFKDNFAAAVLTLGAQVMSIHYKLLNNKGYDVPAAVLFNDVSQGKSTATKAALDTRQPLPNQRIEL